jgi:hypothetical protein
MKRAAVLGLIVSAAWISGAAAQTPPPSLRDQCGADVKNFCADVQKGEGRIIQCLQKNQDKLSKECKDAMASLRRPVERKATPMDSGW